jgi:hypothetical protein|tara:strand:+ start:262 stop:519 length:258 start_codon:yes stop_codon:yes gene_type:complete
MNGIIRKISIGDIKTGITYKKNQMMFGNSIQVMEILHNEDFRANTGKTRYDIFIKKNDCKYIRLWKSFIDVPVAVEYDVEVELEV